jgi:hypothetical protein
MPFLANLGIPMLAVQMPLLLGALPAVVFIESYLLRHWYSMDGFRAVKLATVANLLSTVLGFPIMWFLLFMLQALSSNYIPSPKTEPWQSIFSVTAQSAWLENTRHREYWMVPTACLVLLVPAFFMTVFIESFVYRRTLARESSGPTPMQATWRMHWFSYGFLAMAGLFLLTASIVKHQRNPKARHERPAPTSVPDVPVEYPGR